jgi:hypothetical protein
MPPKSEPGRGGEGRVNLLVASDRTTRFAFIEPLEKATRLSAGDLIPPFKRRD